MSPIEVTYFGPLGPVGSPTSRFHSLPARPGAPARCFLCCSSVLTQISRSSFWTFFYRDLQAADVLPRISIRRLRSYLRPHGQQRQNEQRRTNPAKYQYEDQSHPEGLLLGRIILGRTFVGLVASLESAQKAAEPTAHRYPVVSRHGKPSQQDYPLRMPISTPFRVLEARDSPRLVLVRKSKRRGMRGLWPGTTRRSLALYSPDEETCPSPVPLPSGGLVLSGGLRPSDAPSGGQRDGDNERSVSFEVIPN